VFEPIATSGLRTPSHAYKPFRYPYLRVEADLLADLDRALSAALAAQPA
jgi:hypothetical protein